MRVAIVMIGDSRDFPNPPTKEDVDKLAARHDPESLTKAIAAILGITIENGGVGLRIAADMSFDVLGVMAVDGAARARERALNGDTRVVGELKGETK